MKQPNKSSVKIFSRTNFQKLVIIIKNIFFFVIIVAVISSFSIVECVSINNDWMFQNPVSYYMINLIEFHNSLFIYISFILIIVVWFLYQTLINFNSKNFILIGEKFNHFTILEIIWTIIPTIILLFIAAPSFILLYQNSLEFSKFSYWETILEKVNHFNIKIVAHQWYWSYEYSNIFILDHLVDPEISNLMHYYPKIKLVEENAVDIDSYMVATEDLNKGYHRLIEVSSRLVLPVQKQIQFLVTSTDVLHCWAIPSLGIKLDACPGRVTTAWSFLGKEGLFFGQCSEICGVNHGYMPIVAKVCNKQLFYFWVVSKIDEKNTVFIIKKKDF